MMHFHGTIKEIFTKVVAEYGKTEFDITVTFCEDSEVASTSHFHDIDDAIMILSSNILEFYADADINDACDVMKVLVNF